MEMTLGRMWATHPHRVAKESGIADGALGRYKNLHYYPTVYRTGLLHTEAQGPYLAITHLARG